MEVLEAVAKLVQTNRRSKYDTTLMTRLTTLSPVLDRLEDAYLRVRDLEPPSPAVIAQESPTPNSHPAVWDLVITDMRERDNTGAAKYQTRLQPHNGRDALVDAYQEALDLVVYLRQAIYERDGS